MAESTGIILAAAGIVAANEAIFAPMVQHKAMWVDFNWRLIPATAVAALVLAGIEGVAPAFGKGLAGLALLSVLIVPVGNAPTPIENLATLFEVKR